MRVIGTAGHVDHGKSTLIEALTGIHPDRLKEEREREMTIDLGFAWLELPGGEPVGIVDVPGHRDFIENMLAGIGGIDAVLFVVAADEGVMTQTREHLAILDILQINGGVIALTKIDMVSDGEWLDLVEDDVSGALKGPFVGFIVFLTSPVTVAVTVAINAALTHLVLMLVGGSRLGFEATFRVAAYAMATSILAFVPFCGSTVGALWSVAVMIVGLYSIHETEPWKAIFAVLAPTLLCLMATGSAVGLLFFRLAG